MPTQKTLLELRLERSGAPRVGADRWQFLLLHPLNLPYPHPILGF